MRSEIDVVTPRNIDEALNLLHQDPMGMRIVAGGSDVIVQLRDGVIKTRMLLNLLSLKELRYIKQEDGRMHIGSLATYSMIINDSLTQIHARILVDAVRQIGAVQLQNTATIGGNLGNASPAGDSLPPLYALGATVVVRSTRGRREFSMEEFFIGYRKTALKPDELIEEVYFDSLRQNDSGAYLKLGLREANAISIVDVAVVLRGRRTDGSFNDVKVALGAVAPTIRRARECEQSLINKPLTVKELREASHLASKDTAPITDIRGSADYRKSVVVSAVYQTLHEAIYGRGKAHE
jgi:xanthine dehydrogenase FAD-binding subunit